MKILRHTENTVGDLEKLVDDYHKGMELLSTVLSTIQIGLLRDQFRGLSDLEGWTKAADRWTHQHSSILAKIRANPVCSRYPQSQDADVLASASEKPAD